MSTEDGPYRITGVSLDLDSRSISFHTDDRTVARMSFDAAALYLHADEAVDARQRPGQEDRTPRSEPNAAITVSGRLRGVPRDGKPDRKGRPTVWAPFLAFPAEEGRAPQHYRATFYGATVPIALGLVKGADVTVRGFIRENADPERDEWLSVVGIVSHPGKPEQPTDEFPPGDDPVIRSPSPHDGAPAAD